MSKLQEYIERNYKYDKFWFAEEVKKSHHLLRISKAIENKYYLEGKHKVLGRDDFEYKGKTYRSSKMVLQTAKSIIKFHTNYLIGKPLSIIGSEDMVREFNKVFRKGHYNITNAKIIDKVIKYGDCYEYVYYDNGKITSKIINSEDGYPIYNEENNYIGFIEYYTTLDNISYYNVFYQDHVEKWNNEGGQLQKVEEYLNLTGLPVHYHNGENESDECFGRSILEDIKPILNKIEYLINKMDDAIYTHSLSPVPVVTGQRIESSVSSDVVGYILNLDDGAEFEYAVANLDYQSIKLLIDTLMQQLFIVANVPSHVMGQTNVANVSEVSLKLLYQSATNFATDLEIYIRDGMYKRIDVIEKLLQLQGIEFNTDDYIDIEFNYSRPVNSNELLQNMQIQREMNAISIRTVIEKSELTNDVEQEIERLREEGNNFVKGSDVE